MCYGQKNIFKDIHHGDGGADAGLGEGLRGRSERAGSIKYSMSAEPNLTRGTTPEDKPYSFSNQ